MGSRVIRKRQLPANRLRQEHVLFTTVVAAVGIPLVLAYLLVAADMRSDLSGLQPRKTQSDQTAVLLGWQDLYQEHWRPRGVVRMLGYMMDGYTNAPDGAAVKTFILMPEAGHILHPAHRIPDQMVEIWLRDPVPFKNRQLVWATGMLSRIEAKPDFDRAAYAMTNALVEPALERDIMRWFSP